MSLLGILADSAIIFACGAAVGFLAGFGVAVKLGLGPKETP